MVWFEFLHFRPHNEVLPVFRQSLDKVLSANVVQKYLLSAITSAHDMIHSPGYWSHNLRGIEASYQCAKSNREWKK